MTLSISPNYEVIPLFNKGIFVININIKKDFQKKRHHHLLPSNPDAIRLSDIFKVVAFLVQQAFYDIPFHSKSYTENILLLFFLLRTSRILARAFYCSLKSNLIILSIRKTPPPAENKSIVPLFHYIFYIHKDLLEKLLTP